MPEAKWFVDAQIISTSRFLPHAWVRHGPYKYKNHAQIQIHNLIELAQTMSQVEVYRIMRTLDGKIYVQVD